MNRNVLCLCEVIGTMIKKVIEEESMVSYIARSVQSTISVLTKNIPAYDVKFASPPVREIDLNFGTGAAGSMLESIVAHLDIMFAQDSISNNREQ